MATIGNPKDDKMQQQTQQMLQDLSSQVQIIRQATMNEQCTSIIGDERKSEIPKMPSPRITGSLVEERSSEGYPSSTQLGTNKFRSVHDQHLSSAQNYLDTKKGTSLDVPHHHIPGGYKRIQPQTHSGKDAQTLSFGHELVSQRPGSKVSLNRGQPSEQGLRMSQENSKKNADLDLGDNQKHQYRQSNYDSQGTIAVRISQSHKKAGYTSSMPRFDCSSSGVHSNSQEHIRTANPHPGFHLMKQDLESSNTSDGPDELLEASDTRTNQENSRHMKERNYHLNQHQGSAVTLHYSTKYKDNLGIYPDQASQNVPEIANSTPKGRPRHDRTFTPQGHQKEDPSMLARADWTERYESHNPQAQGSRYYLKSGNPSSSTKRLIASAHPSHYDSVAQGTHNYPHRPAPFHVQNQHLTSTEVSHKIKPAYTPGDGHSQDLYNHTPQTAVRSDARRPNAHLYHAHTGHPVPQPGPAERTSGGVYRNGQHNNPFKDYSPDPAEAASHRLGEKLLAPGISAPFGHRYCESACSHWVEEPPAELDDRSPKTVDKYSHCGHTVQKSAGTSDKGYLKPDRSAHSYMDLADSAYRRNTSSQGSRIHNPQYQKKASEHLLHVPYHEAGYDPHMGLRSSVENPEHFMSRGPYLASCSHMSSVNQGGAGLARPRGTHNSSCYSHNSGAFVSTKSKKLKKSAMLNSKMSETSTGLTRKDVLEILKLHKSLQTKISTLEGNKISKQKI